MSIILFFLIPASTLPLLFLKDSDRTRQRILNSFLIMNTFLFFVPMIYALSMTPAGESMWNENTGGGAALWLYLFIFPMTALFQLILLILKIVFHLKK